ncbi:GNAT family N-acetyltransferase [Streptomyces radicis]|uniref:GNAT family N-acetyltransferase n=1 Tax=Streptomyces radicis TaxID=1750517 RepID=A0A3A9WEC9_9ACTN|nr:GNAT family N-acetyltransferase [Streptomyces radicis]RKN11365.1 GNAT family N-acetyltransferase [Streptomyces radicis]RKN26613.1 GNAT family N-acetyltransferase [Streptomyces radicis]
MEARVQRHIRALAARSPGPVRVGPFTVRHRPDWSSPYANYAIPDDGAEPSAADVLALIEAFEARDRLPRCEFLPACAPSVERALRAAGFAPESRAPVMVGTPDTLRAPPPVPGLTIGTPDGEAGLRWAAEIQHEAYGRAGAVGEGAIAALRRTLAEGGVVALAAFGTPGVPAGSGACTPPAEGLSELIGLGVVPALRRRGIGAAVTAHLAAGALRRGADAVWLEPADGGAARLYAALGFLAAGEKVAYTRSTGRVPALP